MHFFTQANLRNMGRGDEDDRAVLIVVNKCFNLTVVSCIVDMRSFVATE
jgi:hypothetical protein